MSTEVDHCMVCLLTSTAGAVETSDREDVLLVAVLVPVLSVLVLVILLIPVTVGGWRFWAKRCALTFIPTPTPHYLLLVVYSSHTAVSVL